VLEYLVVYDLALMDQQLDEPDLRSYLGVIARRRWFVIATTLLFVGAAAALSLIPEPEYRVRAQVLTTGVNDPVAMIFGVNGTGDLDRQAVSQDAFLSSSRMRLEVADAYTGSLPTGDIYKVGVEPIGSSDENRTSSVVELSLVSTDPIGAAGLVNTYAETYVELRQSIDIEHLAETKRQLQSLLEETEAEITRISEPIAEIDAQIREDPANAGVLFEQREVTLDGLQNQLDPLESEANRIRTTLGDINLGVELASGGGAEVLSTAWVPDSPVSPDIPLNIAIGLVIGLFVGCVLAFIRDYFDDSVKTKETLQQVTGVSTLGLIPKVAGSSDVVTVTNPTAPAAEAFRLLRTSVKFLGVDRQVRVVQITSPSPGEGKTLVAVNLAVAFAQAGDRVVIVGGDLRRPRMEEVLDVPLTPGLTAVLIGDVTLPQAIQSADAVPNLSVLPAGYPPPNPSELLSGERARRLIDVLGQTYDVVIIDCPPVLPVTDSLVLARMADTTLLVTSANKTSKRSLTRAVELLRQVDAPLVGTVLNSLSADDTFSGESYRYEPVSKPSRRAARRAAADAAAGNGGARQWDDGGDPDAVWDPVGSPPARN
jgi:capsular exopolysaccharide synthesis family protein